MVFVGLLPRHWLAFVAYDGIKVEGKDKGSLMPVIGGEGAVRFSFGLVLGQHLEDLIHVEMRRHGVMEGSKEHRRGLPDDGDPSDRLPCPTGICIDALDVVPNSLSSRHRLSICLLYLQRGAVLANIEYAVMREMRPVVDGAQSDGEDGGSL